MEDRFAGSIQTPTRQRGADLSREETMRVEALAIASPVGRPDVFYGHLHQTADLPISAISRGGNSASHRRPAPRSTLGLALQHTTLTHYATSGMTGEHLASKRDFKRVDVQS